MLCVRLCFVLLLCAWSFVLLLSGLALIEMLRVSIMSRRRKVVVGVVGTLVTLNGVYGGWTWLENTRLVNQITRERELEHQRTILT